MPEQAANRAMAQSRGLIGQRNRKLGTAGVMTLHADSFIQTRFKSFIPLAVFAALVPVVAGCHRTPSADVVATVNGKEIQRSDMDRLYKASLGDSTQQPSAVEEKMQRLQVLQKMINDEILQQRAAKLNLTATDEDVNARLTEIKAPYTEDQFYNLLKQQNLTLDEYKKNLRRQLTTQKLLNKEIESRINITDAEIASYYAANKSDFNLIEPRYHLGQIVVIVGAVPQPNGQPAHVTSEADARKKIEAAHSRLESGEDFATVAASFSEDPDTAPNGGDAGFDYESTLHSHPEAFDAIMKLKPDQFTDVVPVNDNSSPGHKLSFFAIYKLLGREPAGQRELNDPRVHQIIHGLLHDQQKQLLQNAYLEMLQDDAKVRNYFAEEILKQEGQ
jgi:peptidyl-prolyl cis-trans isomerase SurA